MKKTGRPEPKQIAVVFAVFFCLFFSHAANALPVSMAKKHLAKARGLIATPTAASAENARAHVSEFRGKPAKPKTQTVVRKEPGQAQQPNPSLSEVAFDTENQIFSLARTVGDTEAVKARAREFLKSRESPRMHRFLLESELKAGRLHHAEFHFHRAELPWADWFSFWVQLNGRLIMETSGTDWVKFGLLVILLTLILHQARGFLRDLHHEKNRLKTTASPL